MYSNRAIYTIRIYTIKMYSFYSNFWNEYIDPGATDILVLPGWLEHIRNVILLHINKIYIFFKNLVKRICLLLIYHLNLRNAPLKNILGM